MSESVPEEGRGERGDSTVSTSNLTVTTRGVVVAAAGATLEGREMGLGPRAKTLYIVIVKGAAGVVVVVVVVVVVAIGDADAQGVDGRGDGYGEEFVYIAVRSCTSMTKQK